MTVTLAPVGEFAQLLRQLRLRAGLSQNRLARQAAIDPAYVYRIEKGGCPPPSRQVVLRLWAALAAAPDDRERLLVAAGYCPEAIMVAGGWDPFIRTLRRQVTADLAGILDRLDETLHTD
jgi:transcriptional regulator with XRE-family HTH domain